MLRIKRYTADEEEPDCNKCDFNSKSENICNYCGKHFWCYYGRTEVKEIKSKEEMNK